MRDVDAMMKRFEERNAGAVEEERERTRLSRIILCNVQELVFRTLSGAALEACKRLEIDPTTVHGEIRPNHELRKMEVVLEWDDGVTKLRTEERFGPAEVQRIFREEFSTATKAMEPEREANAAAVERFLDGVTFTEVTPAELRSAVQAKFYPSAFAPFTTSGG